MGVRELVEAAGVDLELAVDPDLTVRAWLEVVMHRVEPDGLEELAGRVRAHRGHPGDLLQLRRRRLGNGLDHVRAAARGDERLLDLVQRRRIEAGLRELLIGGGVARDADPTDDNFGALGGDRGAAEEAGQGGARAWIACQRA